MLRAEPRAWTTRASEMAFPSWGRKAWLARVLSMGQGARTEGVLVDGEACLRGYEARWMAGGMKSGETYDRLVQQDASHGTSLALQRGPHRVQR